MALLEGATTICISMLVIEHGSCVGIGRRAFDEYCVHLQRVLAIMVVLSY